MKVTIADGVVGLDGLVESSMQAERLLAAVSSLAGVVAVEDHLKWPVAAL